jgi:general secretion pathway protein J
MPRLKKVVLGLTLLEVLIALSVFSIIGVASYRVLISVIATQQTTEKHSFKLNRLQKAMNIIDRDLQQLVQRDIRTRLEPNSTEDKKDAASLMVGGTNSYLIEFTRGGRRNPLKLSRSALQRVAYDIGAHPESGIESSSYFQDEARYLRRHYWSTLDRFSDSRPITQALLPGITSLKLTVIDSDTIQHNTWPPIQSTKQKVQVPPIALQLIIEHETQGEISRLYKVY